MPVADSTLDATPDPYVNHSFETPRGGGSMRIVLVAWLDKAIYAFLALFAILLPHSIKGAERAWKAAFLLWLIKLIASRTRPLKQALTAPLLAYVVLSGISTALSPDPYLSWDRMKYVGLFLAGIAVAQNLRRMAQVRVVVVLFVLSACTTVLFTVWQYTYGIGARFETLPATSPLFEAGMRPKDVVTAVNGHSVRTPDQFLAAIRQLSGGAKVELRYFAATALWPTTIELPSQVLLQSRLGSSEVRLGRGHPWRARGTLGHWVVFAEMLMQAGCMGWALMLARYRDRKWLAALYTIAFAGLTWAIFMTETRAAIAGLAIGCLVSLFALERGALRWLAVGVLVVIVAGATVWIQRSRGVQWVDRSDISVHFRALMWEDGLRLIRQHPWFGVGMETVRVHWLEWNIRGFIEYHVQSHFHSTYLQLAVERGVPTLLAWLWFSVAYVILLVRLIKRLRPREALATAIVSGVLAGFVAFSSTGLLHYNLGEEPLAMILYFFYGLTVAIDRISATPEVGGGGLL